MLGFYHYAKTPMWGAHPLISYIPTPPHEVGTSHCAPGVGAQARLACRVFLALAEVEIRSIYESNRRPRNQVELPC